MTNKIEKHDLVVGVDFGTSYTGVAYSHVADPEKINIIVEWPGMGRNHERLKAPTEISYLEPPRWGYDIPNETPRYGWFKLLLDLEAGEKAYNDTNLAATIQNISRGDLTVRSLFPGKTASEMATDYLKLVYAHSMKTIRKNSLECHFEDLRIKFVITTPAMWSPKAQDETRRIAEKSGFGSRPTDIIEMVSEPEAAANYMLRKLGNRSKCEAEGHNMAAAAGWEVGNQIMVCDAGGGTVDIVVYEILEFKPILKLSESIIPQGGLCGAVGVDFAFHNLLASKLGNQAHLLNDKYRSSGSYLMQSFDTVKNAFGSSQWAGDDHVYTIRHDILGLQPIEKEGITLSKIPLTHREMKSIFDPTTDTIVRLVNNLATQARSNRLNKDLLCLIVVGGFGGSFYLYDKLDTWAKSQDPPIFIPSPSDGWGAIAKGAVAFGLESLHLDSRQLSCHYGVYLDFPFDDEIHNEKDSRISAFDDNWYCTDTIEWFARKNDSIEYDKRIRIPFLFTMPDTDRTLRLQLVTSKYNEPPKSRKDTRATRLPPLTISLTHLPVSAFQRRQIGGFFGFFASDIYRSKFSLEMVIKSASLSFEVRHNGERLSVHQLGELQGDARVLDIS